MRTGNLGFILGRRDHKVLRLASAFNHFSKTRITKRSINIGNGSDIFLLKGAGCEKHIAFSRIFDRLVITIKFLTSFISAEKQIIAVTTLPSNCLACAAVKYERIVKTPIAVDVRELWPDVFRKMKRVLLNQPLQRV